jgi:glycosyltransferase involved in cell wall biosynthesis
VASKVAALTNRVLDVPSGGVGLRTLLRTDVFHSPIYALPPLGDRRVKRVKHFLTVYDMIPLRFPEFTGWGDAFRSILGSLRSEDHALVISEYTRGELLDVRPDLDPARVHVTLLAADPERFHPCGPTQVAAARARYGIPDAPYVLSVGTLQPRKNIPLLIRSFAALVRAGEVGDLHLVLTGRRGWDFDEIFAEAADRQEVRDRIIFTGYVDEADLAPLYSGALVFAYPSLAEGFGLPPLEAMQCGTPVITSNTSSLPEVVGDAGVLVDPRDGDALAQAILDVYRDSDLRADLAARATARARQFTWERYAQQTVDAYRAAL